MKTIEELEREIEEWKFDYKEWNHSRRKGFDSGPYMSFYYYIKKDIPFAAVGAVNFLYGRQGERNEWNATYNFESYDLAIVVFQIISVLERVWHLEMDWQESYRERLNSALKYKIGNVYNIADLQKEFMEEERVKYFRPSKKNQEVQDV